MTAECEKNKLMSLPIGTWKPESERIHPERES